MEKGGAGGYAPSPNAASVSGGVTPRIPSSPRTKPRGTLEPPSRIQILPRSALTAENQPAGVLRTHPNGPLQATPTLPPPVLPARPMEELRMARPARARPSPVASDLKTWGDFVRMGGGKRVLHPCQSPAPRSSGPTEQPVGSDVEGCSFALHLCGTLLPGD